MDFLQDVKMNNVIPADATIKEGALYVIEHGEAEFNKIVKEIGLKELAYTESNGKVVTNEASVKSIVDGIIQWLKDKWASLKNLFDRALKFVTGKITEFKSKISAKRLEHAKKAALNLKDKDKDGNTKVYGKTYQFTNLDKVVNMSNGIWAAIRGFEKDINNIVDGLKISDDVEEAARIAQDGREKLEDARDIMYRDIAKEIGVSADDVASDSGMISAIESWIKGEEVEVTKDYINKNIDDIFKSATDSNNSVKDIKKVYNSFKKDYNDSISYLNKQKVFHKLNSQVFSTYRSVLKSGKNTGTSLVGAILGALKAKISVDQKIIMKLTLTSAKEQPTNESATPIESSSYQTELVSLFNF